MAPAALILQFDEAAAADYTHWPQKIRVLSERWFAAEAYCPACGAAKLQRYGNNQPVADFCCGTCGEQFELKSKNGLFGRKVVNGSYRKMIERLNSDDNPNLVLLSL